jgi:hypothetical protein
MQRLHCIPGQVHTFHRRVCVLQRNVAVQGLFAASQTTLTGLCVPASQADVRRCAERIARTQAPEVSQPFSERAERLCTNIDAMIGHVARIANQERFWPDQLKRMRAELRYDHVLVKSDYWKKFAGTATKQGPHPCLYLVTCTPTCIHLHKHTHARTHTRKMQNTTEAECGDSLGVVPSPTRGCGGG